MSSSDDTGTLYLVPNTLGKTPENNTIPDYVLRIVRELDLFIVEQIPSAVRYLQWVGETVPEYEIDFYQLTKDTPGRGIDAILQPVLGGRDGGLLSEAGCPGIADPGARLVEKAHDREVPVVPLSGPSSIFLALMGAGFNGQNFAFHGYLPLDDKKRKNTIKKLEKESEKHNRTQIFMETPYRNDDLARLILDTCRETTEFCAASSLTLPGEQIISRTVGEWRREGRPAIGKQPTVFLLFAGHTKSPE